MHRKLVGIFPIIILTLFAGFLRIALLAIFSDWALPERFWGFSGGAGYPFMKLLTLLCDSATAWLLYFLFRRKNQQRAFWLATIYLFIPAVLINTFGGFANSFFTLLLTLTVFLWLRNQTAAALFGLTATFLVDSRGLFLAIPFFCERLVNRNKRTKSEFLILALSGAFFIGKIAHVIFTPAPKVNHAANLLVLLNRNHSLPGNFPFFGHAFSDPAVILLLLLSTLGFYFMYQKKRRKFTVLNCSWIGLAFFLCWPGESGGGLLPVMLLLFLAFGLYRAWPLFYGLMILNISAFFNTYTVLANAAFLDRIMYILAILNITLFLGLTGYVLSKLPGPGQAWRNWLRRYSQALTTGLTAKLEQPPFAITGKDYFFLGLLALVYALILFGGLGSRTVPQTGYDFKKPQDGIEVRLTQKSDLRTLAFYDAEGRGSFRLEFYREGKWEKAGEFSCDDYYVLKRESLAGGRAISHVEALRIIPQPSAGHINEIAFSDASNRLIPVQTVINLGNSRETPAGRHPLFDEQSRMLQKPSYMNSTYFDEIYHGRTAYEFVKGTSVYETTHPPLGKDLLALGILLFGMNPFGMRFMHAVAGLLLIVTLFFLGRMVLATRFGAYALMCSGMLDFMPFVQSRYATIDSTSVLFITLMFLFTFSLVRQQVRKDQFLKILGTLFWVIIFFALGAATKWTAIYGSAGVVLLILFSGIRQIAGQRKESDRGILPPNHPLLFKSSAFFGTSYSGKKLLIGAVVLFLLIAPLVYFLTYLPYLHASGVSRPFSREGLNTVLQSQKSMYRYHSRLTASHPFASSWWSWPFNFKPLWLYTDPCPPSGEKGSIVSMGNPFIWYLGFVGILIFSYFLIKERFLILFYIFVCFGAQYLPWILVSRISFIYHFYPVLPWFLMCAVLLLEPLWTMQHRKCRSLIYLLAGMALAVFVLFYPVLVGLDRPPSYIDHFLRWFPRDWVF